MMTASTVLCVAAIQMVSSDDVAANLQTAQRLIADAVEKGARLVSLPENFAYFAGDGVNTQDYDAAAIRLQVAKLARQYQVYLQAGSIAVPATGSSKFYASSFIYNPQGQEIARYNKIHLFDAMIDDSQQSYCESARYAQGDKIACAAVDGYRVGMGICYDLRFPELFQQLRQQGADIITLPSAFTYVTGKKHWETLLRARAIETQCYVVAANQGGQHSHTQHTWGHSMIIDPDGTILAEAQQGEAVLLADVDRETLQNIRQAMPLLQHKRSFS